MSLYMNWLWIIVGTISGLKPLKLQWSHINYISSLTTIDVMPAPALIAAGASILGQGINAITTSLGNQASRKWNEAQYNRMRADALADWNMQNEYNSPKSQMERLRAAGLNPHLIYKGGATYDASPVRSSTMQDWRPEPPKFDLGQAANSGLSAYYDTQIKEAQTDNLKAQNDVIRLESALKAAQTMSTLAQTDKTTFETGLAKELKTISLESAGQALKKLVADTEYTIDNNERQRALSQSTLQKAAEEILNLRATRANTQTQSAQIREQIQNLRKDGVLKELEIELKKIGATWSDPAWMRFLQQNLHLDPKEIREKASQLINNFKNPPTDREQFWKPGGTADRLRQLRGSKK